GNRKRVHPAWYHHWEVKWRYPANNTDWIAIHPRLQTCCYVRQHAAHHQRWSSSCKFYTFNPTLYFTIGLTVAFTVFNRNKPRELLPMLNEQLLVLK